MYDSKTAQIKDLVYFPSELTQPWGEVNVSRVSLRPARIKFGCGLPNQLLYGVALTLGVFAGKAWKDA